LTGRRTYRFDRNLSEKNTQYNYLNKRKFNHTVGLPLGTRVGDFVVFNCNGAIVGLKVGIAVDTVGFKVVGKEDGIFVGKRLGLVDGGMVDFGVG